MRMILAAVLFAGCGVPEAEVTTTDPLEVASMTDPAKSTQPTRTVIRLAQRSGLGAEGLTFSPRVATVPQLAAQLLVSSSDCGARGRWVDLVAGEGVTFCTIGSECNWVSQMPIGGSDADGTGLELLVRRGETIVGRLKVVAVTPTPFEWYETDAPFDVTVDAF